MNLDNGIKNIVIELNKLDFITEYSCSGLFIDHIKEPKRGYILFSDCLSDNQVKKIKLAADYAGLIVLPPRKIETIFYGENNYTDKYIGYESRYEIVTRLSSDIFIKNDINDDITIGQWDNFIKKIHKILGDKND